MCSVDGDTIYVQAPNDGTFSPGPATLRIRLANAQVFTFPYSFIAWYPPKDGLPGGLAVTAPEGVHYPESVAYAGPIDGLKRHRPTHEPPVHNEEWPQPRVNHDRAHQLCRPVSAPIKIKVVEAMSEKPYETGVLCEGKAAYLGREDIVFREMPDALKGQTFVRGADSDVAATGANFLVMQLTAPSDLFLLWDERGLPKMGGTMPAWVDSGFVDTGSVVWLSAGPMVVLRSRMPVSGPIYLGGSSAYPGKGAVNNYIAVVAAAGAISGTSERRGGSEEGGVQTVQTWVKKTQQSGALDLQVLLYKDNQHLIVRTRQNPFPKGRGYFRITAVDYTPLTTRGAGPETQAEIGQLVAYGEVADIDPGAHSHQYSTYSLVFCKCTRTLTFRICDRVRGLPRRDHRRHGCQRVSGGHQVGGADNVSGNGSSRRRCTAPSRCASRWLVPRGPSHAQSRPLRWLTRQCGL